MVVAMGRCRADRLWQRRGFVGLALAATLALGWAVSLGHETAWADNSGLTAAKGTYQYFSKGKPVTSTWKTIEGKRYYFDEKGYAVTGGAKKIKGKYYIFGNKGVLLKPSKSKVYKLKRGVYYVNKKGQPAGKGWCLVGKKLYRVGSSGRCVTGKTIDGIRLTASGVAQNNTASQLKMAVMKKLSKLTHDGMSKRQKLRKCFQYCLTRGWQASAEPKDIGKKGWMQRCALRMITREKGECFSFACAFAAFAYELGYKPVVRGAPKAHAYVLIDGKAYDNMGPRFGGSPRRIAGAKNWRFASWSDSGSKGTKAAEKKSTKVGLAQENGSYVYYQNGKKLKSAWKTVKGATYYFQKNGKAACGPAKVGGKRYVFSSKGKLQTGKKTRVVSVSGDKYRVTKAGRAKAGWTANKKGLYLENGRRATGLCCYKGKLYWFSKDGTYHKTNTAKVRAAAREKAEAAALLALVGDPVKKRTSSSCHPLTAVYGGGQDVVYTYKNATLSFFRAPDGTMFYLGCE